MSVVGSQSELNRGLQLLETLEPFQDLVVLMHDNPDPDAIASGWAIHSIIQECLGRTSCLVGGGAIVRAENRQLVSLLKPPLTMASELDITRPSGVILVDCGLMALNHLPFAGLLDPIAVIDHHPSSRAASEIVPFQDIRTQAAASASIATSYLWELKQEPYPRLASALLYAIRSETRGIDTQHSELDRRAIRWLTRWANPTWIADVENAPLSRAYFRDLTRALEGTVINRDSAFCLLHQAQGEDVTGELADLLIRCEGIRRVMCAAIVNATIVVSVRVEDDEDDAGALVRTVLDGLGHGGGHAHRAGGRIAPVGDERASMSLQEDLYRRWLKACDCEQMHAIHLVAPTGAAGLGREKNSNKSQ